MRGRCPFFMHKFDKTTHKCSGCGRWERGFAPKKDAAKCAKRDECQICEAKFALDARGNMVHHGYKRPGIGFIVGDCMAVGCKPFPAYDALERYLGVCQRHVEAHKECLEKLPTLTTLLKQVRDGDAWSRKIKFVEVTKPTAPEVYDWDNDREGALKLHAAWRAWSDVYNAKASDHKEQIRQGEREIARVGARLEKARTLTSEKEKVNA